MCARVADAIDDVLGACQVFLQQYGFVVEHHQVRRTQDCLNGALQLECIVADEHIIGTGTVQRFGDHTPAATGCEPAQGLGHRTGA
ncbi:hypothetical protein D3C71_1774890 [compost metagenome]